MEEILDLGVKKEINVFGVAMLQLFVCSKALSWHKSDSGVLYCPQPLTGSFMPPVLSVRTLL